MTGKCEWRQPLPGLNGYLWGYCLLRSHLQYAGDAALSLSHSSRLSTDRWLTRFGWSVSTTSSIIPLALSVGLASYKRRARHKRRAVMMPATDTNTKRGDLSVPNKHLLPRVLLRLILMSRFAFKLQRFELVEFFFIFFYAGEKISAQFHCCFFSFHGSAGMIRALLITFSYDLDLKGQGNQYNSH